MCNHVISAIVFFHRRACVEHTRRIVRLGAPDAGDVPLVGSGQLGGSALRDGGQAGEHGLRQAAAQLRASRNAFGQQQQQQAAPRSQPQQPAPLPALLTSLCST